MSQKVKEFQPESLVVVKLDHQLQNNEPNGFHMFFRKQPHSLGNPTLQLIDKDGDTVKVRMADGSKCEAEYYFTGAFPLGADSNGIPGGTISVMTEWCLRYTAAGDILRDPVRRAKLFSDMGI